MRSGRLLCAVALFGFLSFLFGAEPSKDAARPAVTSLPRLPDPVHDALQGGDFASAVKLIEALLAEEKTPNADYLTYLKGRGLLESAKFEPAIETFKALEKQFPKSPWIARSRFGRAAAYAQQRNFQAAGDIYKSETERLLSSGRRDELTAIYLEFADRYFDGVPKQGPAAETQPDYTQALGYYQQALELRPSLALRQRIELRIARCHQELNQLPQAIEAYQRFIKQYAGKETRPAQRAAPGFEVEAQYQLGRAQLAAGQPAEARKTWQDFLTSDAAKEAGGDRVAEASYRLAHTYGVPAPPTVGDLELGVAALEAFLKAYPKHNLAAQAEFEIAQSYIHHGRHEQAVAALKKLIANPAYAKATQVPAAWNLLGQSYAAQKKYAEAIAAWHDFLDKYPTDPSWSQVQQVIIDTEYAIAQAEQSEQHYAEARKLWETFLNKYPLDPRAPHILFSFGLMHYSEAVKLLGDAEKPADKPQPLPADDKPAEPEKVPADAKADPAKTRAAADRLFQLAIEDWTRLVRKYPGSHEASNAGYMIGVTLEEQLGKLADALEAYKKVEGPFQSHSQQRIAALTSKQLEIVTERKFRSDEKPRIKVVVRNIESVSVKLYRIDMTDYFRKMHLASGVESLDIALIDPDKSWDHPTAKYEQYRRIEQQVEIPIDGPGVTAVTVTSDTLEATTMVVVSDIDIIVKSSRNELFVFAENMRTGQPAADVKLLVSDGNKVFAETVTGAEGILQKKFDELKTINDLRVFAVHEGHSASSLVDLQGLQFAVGLAPRGYLYSDRPAYRAGQLVHLKGLIRWVENDRYVFKKGEKYQLDVYDARGRVIHTASVLLDDFGGFADHLTLPGSAPQGQYRVHLFQPGRDQSYETQFQVLEYQLEPIRFTVELPQKVFFRGEHIKGKFILSYYYGTPLAGRTIQYRLADDRLYTAETDANGEVAFDLPTQRYSESQPLQLVANYAERNLATGETVFLATRGFEISLSTLRRVYIAGETFDATLAVKDPAGKPVGVDLKLEVLEFTQVAGKNGERLLETHATKADGKTGEARQTLKIDKGGRYILRATGTDRFGNPVSGSMDLFVSGDADKTRLRILADKHHYQVGDTGKLQLHWREKPALALVTFEGAAILGYKLIALKTGTNPLDLPLEEKLAPNFELSVSVMERNKFHEARSGFRVNRELSIALKADKTTLKPGDPLTVEVTTTDPQGKPISADLSLGLIQKNLLDMFPERRAAINAFFNGGARQVSVRAMTSCTFQYAPATTPINQFVLAEADREKVAANEANARQELAARKQLAKSEKKVRGSAVFEEAAAARPGARRALDGRLKDADGDSLEQLATDQMESEELLASDDAPMDESEVLADQKASVSGLALGGAAGEISKSKRDLQNRAGEGGKANLSALGRKSGVAPTNGPRRANLSILSSELQSELGFDSNSNSFRIDGTFGLKAVESLSKAERTIVALNPRGEFQVVNGMPIAALAAMAKDGFEVLPNMASAETGYWNPAVRTDKDGKATLVIRLPDRSTAWSLQSRGINQESLAGQADISITTKRDLFAEMKTPLALTAGDKIDILVEVHNAVLKDKTVDVTFKTTIGEKSTEVKKALPVKLPGIQELSFPVDIGAGDNVTFELTVASGELRDVSSQVIPIKPNGLPVFATKSGTSAQNTSVIISHPDKLPVEKQTLELVIGPSVNRTLLDTVLGSAVTIYDRSLLQAKSEIERSISDILGGVALLKMIGQTRTTDTPEAQALTGRILSGLSGLISDQRDDGGWSWSGRPQSEKSDRYLTSRAMWALASARRAGFAVPQDTFDKGIKQLQTAFAAADEADNEGKAILLHGLAEAGAADFAQANRLHRNRNLLSASGLLHVSLVLVRLDRKNLAQELLELAKPKIAVDPALINAGQADAALKGCVPWMQSGVELRALYLLTLDALEPAGNKNGPLADWLMAARVGSRWTPEKANGPAIVALADWYGRAKLTPEKYNLTIYANDRLVTKIAVDPSSEPSRTIPIPDKLLVAGKPQRINIDIEGRGTFSYSALLGGFVPADQVKNTANTWDVRRRYEPDQRYLDGEAIPRGFGVLTGSYNSFINPLTQLPLGERGEVTISTWRHNVTGAKGEQLDYLVLTEPIPAGTSVLTNSIRGNFERYEITPGAITFYLGDRPYPGEIQFTLVGYLPGKFTTPPTLVRSFYQPERIAVAKGLPLEVLPRGVKSKDEYKLTPQELYELGKRYAVRRDWKQVAAHLTPLFKDYRLQDNIYREVVQLLFEASLASSAHGETVQYFEIIKEKYPDVEVSFGDILKVAQAYMELGEYERSYLVYRATAEASFERESQIAGFLDERGEFLRSVETMERLLREYPSEAYVAMATYSLAQEVYGKAAEAAADQKLRQAKVTRVDLIHAAIHMLDHFLSTWPNDPAADQASFSLANAYLDLEQYAAAIDRARKYADRFPDSKLLDGFWYLIGYSQFALGQDEAALGMVRKVAELKRVDPATGVEVAAANKWQAVYIMGQIYHSLGKAAEAITEYERVKDRFADAAEAIDFFTHKRIQLPEVTTVKPGAEAKLPLEFRNIAGAAVKVYRIDLLKFGLLQRNLSRITAINLAGIRPYHDQELKLGDGKDYRDRTKDIALPLKEEGAYLVVCQGDSLYTSGLVLVTPLSLEVQEDAASGRVRVTVKDTVADKYAHGVHVKVIGSANDQFVSGQTDLRGIFVADAIRGTTTVIARSSTNRYAFHRGKTPLGQPVPAATAPAEGKPNAPPAKPQSQDQLLDNLRDSNGAIQQEQRNNYRNLLRNKKQGVQVKEAY